MAAVLLVLLMAAGIVAGPVIFFRKRLIRSIAGTDLIILSALGLWQFRALWHWRPVPGGPTLFNEYTLLWTILGLLIAGWICILSAALAGRPDK